MKPKQAERYSRQILFPGIGQAGQEALLDSSVVLIGCGALGTAVANLLARSGVGRIRIVDRDFVEPSNLQRQTLFEESDARECLPKAVAAERRLHAIDSEIVVEGVVADLSPSNIRELLDGFPLIVDGTDNFETRLLINDAAISMGTPWVYAATVASYGATMTVIPGKTPCLACLLEGEGSAFKAGMEETCDTSGILNAAVGVIASIEAAEALKILAGKREALNHRLVSCDVWTGRFQSIRVARDPDCRACVRHQFDYLEGDAQPHVTMCGRDSVQIHERNRHLDLVALAQRLNHAGNGDVRLNDFLLKFRVPPYEMTVFTDGRAIIKGTKDPAIARSIYARYVGA